MHTYTYIYIYTHIYIYIYIGDRKLYIYTIKKIIEFEIWWTTQITT